MTSKLKCYLEHIFSRRRCDEKVARRETSGYHRQHVRALKGRNKTSAAPPAREILTDLFQTFHLWLLSCCRFAAQAKLFRHTLSILVISNLLSFSFYITTNTHAQNTQTQNQSASATLGLEQGFMEFETPDFKLKLVKASQTIAALQPKGANGFDFAPADRLEARAKDGYYHLGDLLLRARVAGSDKWQEYSTATARKPVQALTVSGQTLALADLSSTLPDNFPIQITRSWILDNGRLVLRFDLKNRTSEIIQIGALSIPMIFNNMLTVRTLQQAHETCSFFDPYIGQDAGYLQVTRLKGSGPSLVVVPEGKTPFEAYQLLNEPVRPLQTFEGAFAWTVHSQAYAENEWRGVEQWNTPTSTTLAPNETKTYGVKFLVSDEIRNIEKTLAANQRPFAVGIPGYILPMDLDAKLFLNYSVLSTGFSLPSKQTKQAKACTQNCKHDVSSITVEPKDAITIREDKPTRNGLKVYTLRGKNWGRARLTITYDDNTKQTINYYVIKPSSQAVSDLGNFLMTKQWFDDANDPFRRSPSVMSYDRETDKIVTQDSRVWIVGLGDEGGSGSGSPPQ